MKALRIRSWDKHYENNRSRELKRPEWLPLPNKFDGTGFMELLDHPAGMSHYGAWCLLLAAASRMPTRGLLVTDSGKAMTTKDIARMTRGSAKGFDEALPRLLAIGWVEEVEVNGDVSNVESVGNADPAASGEDAEGQDDAEESQPSAGIPQQCATRVPLNGKGNGKGNMNSDNPPPPSPPHTGTPSAGAQRVPDSPAAGDGGARDARTESTADRPAVRRIENSAPRDRIHGGDLNAARKAIALGAVLGLVAACGGECGGALGAEWRRDAHGLQVGELALILWGRLIAGDPIRKPSGLRAARAEWRAMTSQERRQIARTLGPQLGLPMGPDAKGAA